MAFVNVLTSESNRWLQRKASLGRSLARQTGRKRFCRDCLDWFLRVVLERNNGKNCTFLNSGFMAHTSMHNLSPPAEQIEIMYTKDPVDAEAWLRNNVIDCSAKVLGFDIEWKPQFVKKRLGGVENKTAVLQLAVDNSCLVLHVHHMKKFPKSLAAVLKDTEIKKVGSGILQDAVKLRRDKGLICHGRVDTQTMAKSCGVPANCKLGLKALAERFLGSEFVNLYHKPKSVALSNWERFSLMQKQVEYAALDAWIGLKIFRHMESILNHADVNIPFETSDVEIKIRDRLDCSTCGKRCNDEDRSCHCFHHEQSVGSLVTWYVCEACGKKCKTEEKLLKHISDVGHVRCLTCKKLLPAKSRKHEKLCKTIHNLS